jgi:hypothetical protein
LRSVLPAHVEGRPFGPFRPRVGLGRLDVWICMHRIDLGRSDKPFRTELHTQWHRYTGMFGHEGSPSWTGSLSSERCCLWAAIIFGWSLFSGGISPWTVACLHSVMPVRWTKRWFESASVGSFQRPIFRIRIDTGPFFDLRIVPRSGPRIGLRPNSRSGLRTTLWS